MKYLVALFCLVSSYSWSQISTVSGLITNSSSTPLSGATLLVNNDDGYITDENGKYSIPAPRNASINIKIQYLGYRTIDTTIVVKNDVNTINFVMAEVVFDQPKIEVIASGYNAFNDNNWVILDFDVVADKILILYIKRRKPIIGLFEQNGFLITEQKLKKGYSSIHKSCGGNYHIVGTKECMEISTQNNSITVLAKYPTSKFESLIEPCVFKQGETAILKSFTHHNKKATYHGFGPMIGKQQILEIFDEKGAELSQSYYREIIGTYHQTVESPDSTAINYGSSAINIIARNEWSGDVKDLIINNDMHQLVGLYLSTQVENIKTVDIPYNNNLVVLDPLQQKAHLIDVKRFTAKPYKISTDVLSDDFDFYYDPIGKQCYVIDDDQIKAVLKPESQGMVQTDTDTKLNLKGYNPKGVRFADGQLYYYSKYDAASFATRLYKTAVL